MRGSSRTGRSPRSSACRSSSRSARNRSEATTRGIRVAFGDPLKLETVLARHPKLRIVVSGAAWPFGDAMVALMWRYPRVWVDTAVIAWSLPRAELDDYLKRLIRARCGDRISSGPAAGPRDG